MVSSVQQLAEKLNDALGENALSRIYSNLSNEDFNLLVSLMNDGRVNLHTDSGLIGFTIEDDQGAWTSDGY